MSEFYMHISSPVPFGIIKNRAKVNPLIINYHVVEDRRLPHIINLYRYRNVLQFGEDLDFLKKNFHPLGLEEFLYHLHENTPWPENSFMLTFDDGFREIHDIVAPILLSKNLSATVFLTTNFIDNRELGYDSKRSLLIDYLMMPENGQAYKHILAYAGIQQNNVQALYHYIINAGRNDIDKFASEINYDFNAYLSAQKPYLTSDHIRSLIKKGFTFGAHSLDHPRYSEIPLDEQLNQTISSIKEVCSGFSIPYKVFAFPYYDKKVTMDFFNAIVPFAEATFGTHGLLTDQAKNHFQRISVEKYKLSAETVIKFHFIRKTIYRYLRREMIIRPEHSF